MKKAIILLFLLFIVPAFGTVSDGETVRQSFACNGVTTTFTFTFKCNSSDDVLVYAPLTLTSAPVTALTVDVDYTIAPTGGSYLNGGVVTIAPALASTYTVKIVRRIKLSRETSSGAITPTSIVAALDKIMRGLQDAEDRKDRSLHIPDSDDISLDMSLPPFAQRAGTLLGFDLAGEPYAFSGTIPEGSTSVFGGIFIQTANAESARGLLELATTDPVEFAAIVGTTGTFSGVITANSGLTLGAGDDLVGSATSAINMNAFDVDENGVGTIGTSLDIASTIAVVGTIDDDSMATSTDTTLATSESIKAYIDAKTGPWAKFLGRTDNGACTIRASSGITSVTRTAAGKYTLVFSTAWSDNDYAFAGTVLKNGSSAFLEGDNTKTEDSVQTTDTLYLETTAAGGGQVDVDAVWITTNGNL